MHDGQGNIRQERAIGGNWGQIPIAVDIRAGQDITAKGSEVIGDEGASLMAGRDVSIAAAQTTSQSSSFNETKKSGLFSGGGLSITIGKQQQSLEQQGGNTSAAASTVGAIAGNVNIQAGRNYQQTGSDLIALKGDIAVVAEDIAIREARETNRTAFTQKTKQSGLTISISECRGQVLQSNNLGRSRIPPLPRSTPKFAHFSS